MDRKKQKGERERKVPIHPTTLKQRDQDGLEPQLASHTTVVASSHTLYWHAHL